MTVNPDAANLPDARPQHFLRNALAFGFDTALFFTAVTFISSTTIMPAFISTLTRSEVVVGMASGVISAGWLLPQLLIASFIARLRRKKPTLIWAVAISRPIILLLALATWRLAVPHPTLMLVVALVSVFGFFLGDAMCSVPWFDIVARALPHRRRGAVVGTGQVVGSLGGIAVGIFVRYVLGGSSPWAYPANFAVLFAIGGAIFVLNAVALMFIYEPPAAPPKQAAPTPRQVLASLPRILREDHPFRRLVIVKLVVGYVGGAGAFYVLHATRNLGFGAQDTGLFVSTQVLGSLTAGLLLSLVQAKWGPLVHVRLIITLAALPPLFALLATLLAPAWPGSLLPLYLAAYLFLGIYMSGLSWPFFNWIMEYAQEQQRPIYIALMNTLTAIVMLAPALAGWLARSVSYAALFGVALGIALTALLLSAPLPSTRKAKPAPHPESS